MITYVDAQDVKHFLDTDYNVSLSLIKEGCKILSIPYIGGGTMLFQKYQPEKDKIILLNHQHGNPHDNQLELMKNQLEKQLSNKNYVVMYSKLNKFHPNFCYYNIIAISSSSVDDLKKVLKINKLKAFL
jgi:hypothetical protein